MHPTDSGCFGDPHEAPCQTLSSRTLLSNAVTSGLAGDDCQASSEADSDDAFIATFVRRTDGNFSNVGTQGSAANGAGQQGTKAASTSIAHNETSSHTTSRNKMGRSNTSGGDARVDGRTGSGHFGATDGVPGFESNSESASTALEPGKIMKPHAVRQSRVPRLRAPSGIQAPNSGVNQPHSFSNESGVTLGLHGVSNKQPVHPTGHVSAQRGRVRSAQTMPTERVHAQPAPRRASTVTSRTGGASSSSWGSPSSSEASCDLHRTTSNPTTAVPPRARHGDILGDSIGSLGSEEVREWGHWPGPLLVGGNAFSQGDWGEREEFPQRVLKLREEREAAHEAPREGLREWSQGQRRKGVISTWGSDGQEQYANSGCETVTAEEEVEEQHSARGRPSV